MSLRTSLPSRNALLLLAAALAPACGSGDIGEPGEQDDDTGESVELRSGGWAVDGTEIAPPGTGGDAGSSTPADAGCETETTLVWFPDADGDGFGVTSGGVRACARPPGRWATAGGDCHDEDSRVHPAQRVYFPAPYVNAEGEETFDYDCNGYEDSDPRQPGGAPQCGVLSVTECGGFGYLSTERYGEGVNVLCGSKSTIACKPNTLGLLCGPLHANVDAAHRCH